MKLKIKTIRKAHCLRALVLCFIIGSFIQSGITVQGQIGNISPNSSAVTQAYPQEDKYYFMNIFTENDNTTYNYMNTPGSNTIQAKMDYLNYLYKNNTDIHHGQDGFIFFNATSDAFFNYRKYSANIYSNCWDYGTVSNASIEEEGHWQEEVMGYWRPHEYYFVKGGYKVTSYDDYFYRMESNVTICRYDGLPMDINSHNFDWVFNNYTNISSNLLLSRTNLTAEVINGSERYVIDNPMFFNKTKLEAMTIGENMTLNGRNYTLVKVHNAYYKLSYTYINENVRDYWSFGNCGVINRTTSIYIKKSGEAWCYEIHRHFTDTDPSYLGGYYSENRYIITEDTVQFWLGWHHYEPGPYFLYITPWYLKSNWIFYLVGAVGIGALIIRTALKKKSKKGGKK